MKVLLIETAASDRPGSMQRYADSIELALSPPCGFEISRVCLAPTAAELKPYPRRVRMLAHHATVAWRALRIVKKIEADIYHLVDGSHGYVVRWLKRGRSVVTVHDIIPFLQCRKRFSVLPPSRSTRWLIDSSVRSLSHATRVMSDSQATASDLMTADPKLKGRVQVVPLAVPADLLPTENTSLPDWSARRNHQRPYILHLGNNGFYKNRLGVVRIFDRIRSSVNCRMILAGPAPNDELLATIRDRKLEELVEFIIDPDDSQVLSLYRDARLLLFPSYYEGFGWPPLEAMGWGCPVVCSRSGSLPEVAGDAALTADVENEAELADHCLTILTNQAVADRLVAAGHAQVSRFSLDNFRRDLIKVYSSLV